MLANRSRTATLIAGSLLALQALGAAAQSPDPATAAPIVMTATLSVGQCRWTTEPATDGVERIRDMRCDIEVIDGTDPRFGGAGQIQLSEDGYYAGGLRTIGTEVYRIEDENGAWQSSPTVGLEFDDRSSTTTVVFTGEGAHEGLTAVVEIAAGDGSPGSAPDARMTGVILVGPPPPASDPAYPVG